MHDEVDTRLLATAARIRGQWTDPASTFHYPINTADQARGVGPLMGRYPDGRYDGDNAPPNDVGHPWVPCTANFAELYYLFATAIRGQQAVPLDALSAPFFGQLGIDTTTPFKDAADLLDAAGDRTLAALILHSDHLELVPGSWWLMPVTRRCGCPTRRSTSRGTCRLVCVADRAHVGVAARAGQACQQVSGVVWQGEDPRHGERQRAAGLRRRTGPFLGSGRVI